MSGAPLLEARVTSRFGGVIALEGLDLEVPPGEILGLIGPNGSGKTTFFNVVTGIYPRDCRAHHLRRRRDHRPAPQAVYRAGIARTFQRSRLCLPLSIFDNIMIGNHRPAHHGPGFNLLRRGAFRREYEATLRRARAGRGVRPAAGRSPVRAGGGFP